MDVFLAVVSPVVAALALLWSFYVHHEKNVISEAKDEAKQEESNKQMQDVVERINKGQKESEERLMNAFNDLKAETKQYGEDIKRLDREQAILNHDVEYIKKKLDI